MQGRTGGAGSSRRRGEELVQSTLGSTIPTLDPPPTIPPPPPNCVSTFHLRLQLKQISKMRIPHAGGGGGGGGLPIAPQFKPRWQRWEDTRVGRREEAAN